MQMAQRLQRLDAVRARLPDRQRIAPPVGAAPPVGDVLQRLAADVLHDDVPVQRARPLVQVLHEVVDADDVGVLDLGEEPPLGDRRRHRVLVARVQQALEDHPAVGDGPVHGQVDPAEPAVREAARHLVLAVHHVARPQLRHEGVRVPAARAEPFRTARPVTARPADRRAAVGPGAEPAPLGHLRTLHDRRTRIGPRHRRYRHQSRAQPPARRTPAGRAGTAHRDGPRRHRARQPLRQPPRHRPARRRGTRRPPRRARRPPRRHRGPRGSGPRGSGPRESGPRGSSPRGPGARHRAARRPPAARGPTARDARGRGRHRAVRGDDRSHAARVAVQLAAAHVLVRAAALRPLALPHP
ncbi:hypothetical protein SUDANB37_01771 [Streptomyces sp. enrichment culture]